MTMIKIQLSGIPNMNKNQRRQASVPGSAKLEEVMTPTRGKEVT